MCEPIYTTTYYTDGATYVTTTSTSNCHQTCGWAAIWSQPIKTHYHPAYTIWGVPYPAYTTHLTTYEHYVCNPVCTAGANKFTHHKLDELPGKITQHGTNWQDSGFRSYCSHSTVAEYDLNHWRPYTTAGPAHDILFHVTYPPPPEVGPGLNIKTCSGCISATTGIIAAFVALLIATAGAASWAEIGPFAPSLATVMGGMSQAEFDGFVSELGLGADEDVYEEFMAAISDYDAADIAAPETTAPGTTAPGTTAPGTTAPETTAPGTTAPGTTAPGTTAPETTAEEKSNKLKFLIFGIPDKTVTGSFDNNMKIKILRLNENFELFDSHINLDVTSFNGITSANTSNKSIPDLVSDIKMLSTTPFFSFSGGKNIYSQKPQTLDIFGTNKFKNGTKSHNIFTSMRAVFFIKNNPGTTKVTDSDGKTSNIHNKLPGLYLKFNNKLLHNFNVNVSEYDVYTNDYYYDNYNNIYKQNPNVRNACIASSTITILWDILYSFSLTKNISINTQFMVNFYKYLLTSVTLTTFVPPNNLAKTFSKKISKANLKNLKETFPELNLTNEDESLIRTIINYFYNLLLKSNSLDDILVLKHIIQTVNYDLTKLKIKPNNPINLNINEIMPIYKINKFAKKTKTIMKVKEQHFKFHNNVSTRLGTSSVIPSETATMGPSGEIIVTAHRNRFNIHNPNNQPTKITNNVNTSYKKNNSLIVFDCPNKIRLGDNREGGYVIANIPEQFPYDCYIAAGVNSNESFTRDFINKYKLGIGSCYAADGTLSSYPYNYTKNIQFANKYVGGIINDNQINFSKLFDDYKNIFMKINLNGNNGDDTQLIDSFEDSKLLKIKQLIINTNLDYNDISNYFKIDITTQHKLNKLTRHHLLIHAHANNNYVNKLELTYIRRDSLQDIVNKNANKKNTPIILNTTPLPIANLDYPSNLSKPEISLNKFPFKRKT